MWPQRTLLAMRLVLFLHTFLPAHPASPQHSCAINTNALAGRNISTFYVRSSTGGQAAANASFAYFALENAGGDKVFERGQLGTGSDFVAPTASPHVPATAIAGTDYEYLRFTYNSTADAAGQTLYDLTFAQEMECDVLIVAGGGGAGKSGLNGAAGGGGAGGLLYFQRQIIPAGEYAVRVGKGGDYQPIMNSAGHDGIISSFAYLDWAALGGGGGGGQTRENFPGIARDGGSGGGGATYSGGSRNFPAGSGLSGQGHDGGAGSGTVANSGGGGGAGGPGQDATSTQGGDGGIGREIDITGFGGIFYAGGGGGGSQHSDSPGLALHGGGLGGGVDQSGGDGAPDTGGGGGGAGGEGDGGAGGSGVVILRYRVAATINPLLKGLAVHHTFDNTLDDHNGRPSVLAFSQSTPIYSGSQFKIGTYAVELTGETSSADGNYLTFPAPNFYNLYQEHSKASISFWVFSTASGQRDNQRLFSLCGEERIETWSYNVDDNIVFNKYGDGDDAGQFPETSRPTIPPGNWYHFVITVDALSLWTVYVNGQNSELITFSHDVIATDSQIILGRACAEDTFAESNMYYDDFRIYNRVLSQDDVDALYALRYPFFNPASPLPTLSQFTYPSTYSTRTLSAVPGYVPAAPTFSSIDVRSEEGFSSDRNQYWGAVRHPNGKIYAVPFSGTNIGEFDTEEQTFKVNAIADISAKAYMGGVLAPNQMIYLMPRDANNIGKYDPAAETFTTIDISAHFDGQLNNKFYGGVLGANGNVYCVPGNSRKIGMVDPTTDTFSIVFTFEASDTDQYWGGVLALNGKIYLIPADARVGEFDPTHNTLTFIGSKSEHEFRGAVLAPSGLLYFIPGNADFVGKFNPQTDSFSNISLTTLGEEDLGKTRYTGGVLGVDGKIYMIPQDIGSIAVLNPEDDSLAQIDVSSVGPDGKIFAGGVVGPDGKIYCMPRNSGHVGIVELGNTNPAYSVAGGVPSSWQAVLSPFFNKL